MRRRFAVLLWSGGFGFRPCYYGITKPHAFEITRNRVRKDMVIDTISCYTYMNEGAVPPGTDS